MIDFYQSLIIISVTYPYLGCCKVNHFMNKKVLIIWVPNVCIHNVPNVSAGTGVKLTI